MPYTQRNSKRNPTRNFGAESKKAKIQMPLPFLQYGVFQSPYHIASQKHPVLFQETMPGQKGLGAAKRKFLIFWTLTSLRHTTFVTLLHVMYAVHYHSDRRNIFPLKIKKKWQIKINVHTCRNGNIAVKETHRLW